LNFAKLPISEHGKQGILLLISQKLIIEFLLLLIHIRCMKFNKLKRKAFFWVEKLQISKTERIGVVLLLVIIIVLLLSSLFLQRTFNFNQQEYDQVLAEFEKRSALIQQEEKQLAEKYIPQPTVNTPAETIEKQEKVSEMAEPENEEVAPKIVNINTANEQLLQTLDGIGPAYAKRIVEYRDANGPFSSKDELINIKGIGEKRLDNIRPYITLKD
jgi:comEA protein